MNVLKVLYKGLCVITLLIKFFQACSRYSGETSTRSELRIRQRTSVMSSQYTKVDTVEEQMKEIMNMNDYTADVVMNRKRPCNEDVTDEVIKQTKKLKMEMEVDQDILPQRKSVQSKHSRNQQVSPLKYMNKRVSSSSVSSNGDQNVPIATTASGATQSIKRNFKSVTSCQLMSKNMLSINNELFYLFKFLIEDKCKDYYGDAGQFSALKIDGVYDLSLNYDNKKIYIGTYKECQKTNALSCVSKYVKYDNFDANDTVNVYAKFKWGFKLLNDSVYKFVVHVNVGNSLEMCEVKQVECTAKFDRLKESIKNEVINSQSDLLQYFHNLQDNIIVLNRVKCSQNNLNFRNFSLQNISEIKMPENLNNFNVEDEDEMAVVNISRSNKKILCHEVVSVTSEHVPAANCDRYSINYETRQKASHQASFFNKTKNDHTLDTDINQLNELIENNIIQVFVYEIVDMEKCNRNVLAITKFEVDNENSYESL
ncbi:LEF-3 [Clanis bilineata nucleopolyhedrovirus]|uniref:LEF-3 n=1 Tax=Clanis bilineata nucleopolyhedrovirus TaxID=1307957 RepID=Q0N436_9ABAC|nr:LEF-3 [Clanis bilineata nucleopolyhedrovirus]ABF47407.1 LEF-3 [Clanis bilineata nucleopolyhedrovirus]